MKNNSMQPLSDPEQILMTAVMEWLKATGDPRLTVMANGDAIVTDSDGCIADFCLYLRHNPEVSAMN